MCFDSSSDSQANQTQTTQTSDMRVAGGTGSVNVSEQGGSVALTVTDAGAIDRAFSFADSSMQNAYNAIVSNEHQLTLQIDAAMQNVGDANSRLADAWATSKAGEQKVLVVAALLIGGVVAVASFSKGK